MMFLSFMSSFVSFIIVLGVVDVVLRGMALWKAARTKQKYWFIALLIINSLGILPAIYLLLKKSNK